MAVAKWNWHSTNVSKAFGRGYAFAPAWSELVLTNATKAETERAYQTLVNRGPVEDFSVKVWNDICAKIYDLCDEWKINEYYRKYVNFTPFIHTPNRDLWRALARKNWPQWTDYEVEEWCDYIWSYWGPGIFGATAYNTVYSRWLLPVGLTKPEVKRGDRLLSEHIFTLTEFINHWCDLSPIEFGLQLNMRLRDRCGEVLLNAGHVIPESLDVRLMVDNLTRLGESYPFNIDLDIVNGTRKAVVTELQSMPFASPMNFMHMNIQCKVWDKNIEYVVPVPCTFVWTSMMHPVKVPSKNFYFSDSFRWSGRAKGKLGNAYGISRIKLDAYHGARIHPGFGTSYDFSFEDAFFYDGTGRMRYRRPMPLSAITRYAWDGRVFVEHEGIVTMDMDEGFLQFSDNILQSADTSKDAAHTGEIPIREYATDLKVFDSKNLEALDESIVYRADPQDVIVGEAQQVSQTGRFKTDKDISIINPVPDIVAHTGEIHSASGYIEPTFANEQILEVRQGGFRVADGEIEISFRDIQPLDHNGLVDTSENILLGDAPPFEVEAKESEIRASYSGELNYDGVVEQVADAVIETLSVSELGTGLNAFPEIEVVAATIRYAADIGSTRLAKLGVEVEVSTIEKAVMNRVARKLAESNIIVSTDEKAVLIARLLRFMESTEVAGTEAEAEAFARLPRHFGQTNNRIAASVSAFMDSSYVRGDSLIADVGIRHEVDVLAEILRNRKLAEAKASIQVMPEAEMKQASTKGLFGEAIAEAGSDAHIVMAHSILTFAIDIEDSIVSDEDSILAFDVERTLVFK